MEVRMAATAAGQREGFPGVWKTGGLERGEVA